MKFPHSWLVVQGQLRMKVTFHCLMKTVYWSVMMILEEVRFLGPKREMPDRVTVSKEDV